MTNDFFDGTRVLVTGGAGLIGSAFLEQLLLRGARVRTSRRRRQVPRADIEVLEGDLQDMDFCRRACRGMDMVVHAAGVSGGSGQVAVQPIPMFTDSLMLNTLAMEAARLEGVQRFLFVSNSSVYPQTDSLLREEDGSVGVPENETGMVKRVGETQAGLYARSTTMKFAIIRSGNAYGPWDNFDLGSSHVVPALIHKAVRGRGPMELWGDGSALRDFIHTSDIARGGLFLLEHKADGEPVNIASGQVVSIRQLAETILACAGRAGDGLRCLGEAPPAPKAKLLDLTRMRHLGFKPALNLEAGLEATVEWFRSHGEDRP